MTKNMEKAIKKAIEGGYRGYYFTELSLSLQEKIEIMSCDPKWWQALGRTLEWRDKKSRKLVSWCYGGFHDADKPYEQWIFEWHKFIDHLAEGKDVDSFFEELLK